MTSDNLNIGTHICIVSPSLKMGGIERSLTVLANHFVNNGCQVTFISCLNSKPFYDLQETVKIIQPNFKRNESKWNKALFYPRLAKFIRNEVKKADPHTVLCFGDKFNPLVLIALIRTRYPVFISDRTSPDYPFGFTIRLLKEMLYPQSAGFIAQTTRAANYKRQLFGKRLNIKIIPNAIREVHNTNVVRQQVILCVARLAKEKCHNRLLEAFALFSEKFNWRLVFVGDGPLKPALIHQAESLGILTLVDFIGDTKMVDEYLSLSSIFVLPSQIEGFPNALCEAMANGLPVICFDTIPHEDLITHGKEGFVVKNNSISDLCEYMSLLANSVELRNQIGNAAKEKAVHFKTDIIAKRYLDFILSKCKN